MKYCPSCGRAGVEGKKFCPQCGKKLAGSSFEEKKKYLPKPETPFGERNWFERHPGWTLLLVIVCGPFIAWGIAAALIALAMFLPRSIGEAAAIGAITAIPIVYIAMVITTVRWYRQKKKRSKTMADYTRTSGLHLDGADACSQRADDKVETGEYRQAIADYSEAIELNPNDADACYNRGCTYGEAGEYDKAIADYSKVIEVDPSSADAHYNRGAIYSEKGEVDKAAEDLKRCIELSTDSELTKAARQELDEIKNLSRGKRME